MTWQVSLIFFFLFSVALALWRRFYSQKSKIQGRSAPALSYVLGVFPLGLIVGLLMGDISVSWSASTVFVLLVMATGVSVFNWLVFQVSKQLSVALFQTLFRFQAITVIVLGWIFLDEKLTSGQIIGSILLIVGAIIAAQAQQDTKKSTHTKGSVILLAIVASISLGIGIIGEKAALGHMSLSAYYIIGYGMQTLALLVIAQKDLRSLNMKKVTKPDWIGTFLMGALSACAGFFFIYSLRNADNAGLVSAAASFQMPLIAIAGYFILKEKEIGWRLAVGFALSFIGLLVTAN